MRNAYPHDDIVDAREDEERHADIQEHGLDLAEDIRGEDEPLGRCYGAEYADRELAGEDEPAEQRYDQDVILEQLEIAEVHDEEEHDDDDDLVRKRIQEFAERGHRARLSRYVAVDKVRRAQKRKKHT